MEQQSPQAEPEFSLEEIRRQIQEANQALDMQNTPVTSGANQNTLPTIPNIQPTPNKVQDETFAGQSRSFIEGKRADITAQNLSKKEREQFAREAADAALEGEDPRSPKYAADHLGIYKLLTVSDKKFDKMMGQPERSKGLGKLDDSEVPTIGDVSLAELKATRQSVNGNTAALTDEVNKKFPTPDSKDRQYNRKFDQRQRYSSLLRMDDGEFNKEAAKWEKRAARSAKKEARRNARAERREHHGGGILSRAEAYDLRLTGNRLVGKFADTGWDESDLELIREYHEDPNVDATKAIKEMIKDKANLVDHENPTARNEYIFKMADNLRAYGRLDEAGRTEVNSALGKYLDHLDAIDEAQAKKAERLTSKLRAKLVGGVALVGAGIGRAIDKFDEGEGRFTKNIRKGFSDIGAKLTSNEDGPGILRRGHDRVMVEAGIRLNDAWDRFSGDSERRPHETEEEYRERMLKTGKRARNVVLGAVMLYGASRVLGLTEAFQGSGVATHHSDTITNVVAERIAPSPVHHTELASGGIGGGHAIFEDQNHPVSYLAENSTSSVGGGREVEDWINGGHDAKPKSLGTNTLSGGVGGGRDIEDWKNTGHNTGNSVSVDNLGPNEPGVNNQYPSTHELHTAHVDHKAHQAHEAHVEHLKNR